MRKVSLWAVFFILLPFLGLPGCSTPRTDFLQMEREGVEIRVYKVFGMDCPGCHGGLEKLVNAIPGIKTSKANWEEQRLSVAFQPGANVDDSIVYDAIKRANFTPGQRIK